MSSIPDRKAINTEREDCLWIAYVNERIYRLIINQVLLQWTLQEFGYGSYNFDEIFSEIKGNQLGVLVISEILLK